jgi:cephalosporin-C deacetylase
MGKRLFTVRRPEDFQGYWDEVLKIVEDFAPEPRVQKWEQEDVIFEDEYILDGPVRKRGKQPENLNPFDVRWDSHVILTGLTVQKVLFQSFDGQEVGGLLQFPRFTGKHRFPVLIHYAGYGGEVMIDSDFVTAGYAVFNFSHRGMLMGSKGFDRYSPAPLLVQHVEDKEQYAYRSVVIDCLLAIKAMFKIQMVDPNRLGALGTSQGGALAIIAAALSRQVKAAACDLPWLTDYDYVLNHDVGGLYNELKEFLKRFPDKKAAVARTLGYFDTLFFADDLKIPVLMSLGGTDPIAPPGSVRKLFERIPGVKTLLEIPAMGHERSTLFRYLAQKWFDFFLG